MLDGDEMKRSIRIREPMHVQVAIFNVGVGNFPHRKVCGNCGNSPQESGELWIHFPQESRPEYLISAEISGKSESYGIPNIINI